MGVVKFRRNAIWTGMLIAVASGVLVSLLGGCGPPDVASPDLEDKAVLERILAEAVPISQLEERGKPGEELLYLPNKQTPYSGWMKRLDDSGQVQGVSQGAWRRIALRGFR
jgi:hypothetical protein